MSVLYSERVEGEEETESVKQLQANDVTTVCERRGDEWESRRKVRDKSCLELKGPPEVAKLSTAPLNITSRKVSEVFQPGERTILTMLGTLKPKWTQIDQHLRATVTCQKVASQRLRASN